MISVIIPVYNVEPYIDECLKSLMNQVYTDFEVIMVNDGSTDSSPKICKKYLFDERFKLINISNGGVSNARNVGLKEAKGEWIAFLDADDVYDPMFLSAMFETKIQTGSDIVVCKIKPFIDDVIYEDSNDTKFKLLSDKEVYKGIFVTNEIGGFVCNKLFDKNILLNLKFNVRLSICEDMVFTMEAIAKSQKISMIDKNLYHYRMREGSATKNMAKTFEDGSSKYFIAYNELFTRKLVKEEFSNIVKASLCLICVGQKCDYKNTVDVRLKENLKSINKVINKNMWSFIVEPEFSFKKKIITILNHLFNIRRFKR